MLGFKCPQGRGNVPFSFCEGECPDPCHPLPLLAALLESRDVVPGVYSVTEILKPYQVIYLSRKYDHYATPESLIWMIAGSAAHGIIESGGRKLKDQKAHRVEVYNEVDLLFVKSRGTYDYWDGPRKIIWDFKNSKVFPVKKLKEAAKAGDWQADDYFKQLNIYRAFFKPEAEKLRLECLVQGWDKRIAARDGLKKIETIEVPIAPIPLVKEWTIARLKNIVSFESGMIAPPPCTTEETWNGVRCAEYCPAADSCAQFKRSK